MLQELCIPVLKIRKVRIDDVSNVDVSVLDRQNRITTGQVSITFLQETAVAPKCLSREIEAVFEGNDGTVISDKKRLIFDSKEENDQNRSRKEIFVFNKESDKYNGKIIVFKLYEIKAGNLRAFYKEYTYQFQKKLQLDVDF